MSMNNNDERADSVAMQMAQAEMDREWEAWEAMSRREQQQWLETANRAITQLTLSTAVNKIVKKD